MMFGVAEIDRKAANTFRLVIGWGLTSLLFMAPNVLRAGEFRKYESPKTLHVISKSAETMSAPIQDAYSTGTLKQGAVVDAYGELDAEWVAIRPPSGQFDWLAAQHSHLLPGGRVAEIIDTPTPAWIHSDHMERGQFQWQVKLQPTQQINVLGQVIQKLDKGKSRAWYKIDPPPGEFRWMRSQDLSLTPVKASLVKNSKPETIAKDDAAAVQTASSTIINVSSDPVVLGPGEVIVDHDQDPLWDASDSGVTQDASILMSDNTSEPIMVDLSGTGLAGRIFGKSVGPPQGCPNCTPDACCSDCMNNGMDSPLHRLRPINRLLSCLGISIVEAERPPVDMACGGCGLPTCASCSGTPAISHAGSIGSLPSRLDRLPRPVRLGPESGYGDPVIIDRLGAARQEVRESIAQTKERVQERTQSLLADPAKISLGAPLRSALTNRQPILGGGDNQSKDSSWQGLPQNGISSEDLELDVQAPTAADHQRTPYSSDDGAGTMLQTSAPSNKDHSRYERPANNDKAMEPTSVQLQRVAGDLTTIVSKPTEQWKLSGLREEVLTLIENGADPVVRGEARLLLDRIESFEDFRARWMRANSNKIVSTETPATLASVNETSRIPVQTASFQNRSPNPSVPKSVVIKDMAAAQSIIQAADASGWLVAVHSERDDYPKFALTDDAGRLVAYVEADASLNLRGYLEQPVAIHGKRGVNNLLNNSRSIFAYRVIRISDSK